MTSVNGSIIFQIISSICFPEVNFVRWRCRCRRTRRCGRWCSWSRYPGRLLERCWGGFSRTLSPLQTLLLVRQVIPSPTPSAFRDCNRRRAGSGRQAGPRESKAAAAFSALFWSCCRCVNNVRSGRQLLVKLNPHGLLVCLFWIGEPTGQMTFLFF